MEDRKQLEAEEANRTDAFAREMIQNDKLCQIMDQRQGDQGKNLVHSMIRYRQENQRFQDRLEFDLNDPESKLKDHPARIGDEDPRLTVSGMQKYVYSLYLSSNSIRYYSMIRNEIHCLPYPETQQHYLRRSALLYTQLVSLVATLLSVRIL